MKGRNPGYIPGSYWNCCDVCGFDYRIEDMKLTWEGLLVCHADWEPRHPQDFVRAVRDDTAPRGPSRPCCPDVSDNTTEPEITEELVDAGFEDPHVVEYVDPTTLDNADDYVVPGETFTAPEAVQSLDLLLWYWPEEDSGLVTRQTRVQAPSTIRVVDGQEQFTTAPESGINGLLVNVDTDADDIRLDFLSTTESGDPFDWWFTIENTNPYERYIFYIDMTVAENAQKQGLTGAANRFVTYFRGTFNTTFLAFILTQSDGVNNSKIGFQNERTGTDTIREGVEVPTGGGRMRAAYMVDSPVTTSSVIYSSAVPGESFIGEEGSLGVPADVDGDAGSFRFAGTGTGATSFEGDIYIHELRVYGVTEEDAGTPTSVSRTFCEDLVKGEITEVPL